MHVQTGSLCWLGYAAHQDAGCRSHSRVSSQLSSGQDALGTGLRRDTASANGSLLKGSSDSKWATKDCANAFPSLSGSLQVHQPVKEAPRRRPLRDERCA